MSQGWVKWEVFGNDLENPGVSATALKLIRISLIVLGHHVERYNSLETPLIKMIGCELRAWTLRDVRLNPWLFIRRQELRVRKVPHLV